MVRIHLRVEQQNHEHPPRSHCGALHRPAPPPPACGPVQSWRSDRGRLDHGGAGKAADSQRRRWRRSGASCTRGCGRRSMRNRQDPHRLRRARSGSLLASNKRTLYYTPSLIIECLAKFSKDISLCRSLIDPDRNLVKLPLRNPVLPQGVHRRRRYLVHQRARIHLLHPCCRALVHRRPSARLRRGTGARPIRRPACSPQGRHRGYRAPHPPPCERSRHPAR